MKKLLLILITVLYSLCLFAQTSEPTARDAAVTDAYRIQQEAIAAQKYADTLKHDAEAASQGEEKTDTVALKIKEQKADAAALKAKEKKAEADAAYAMLGKFFGQSEQAYPVPNGWMVGIGIIVVLFVAFIAIGYLLAHAINKNEFSLKEALAENMDVKIVKENTQYEKLSDTIIALSAASGNTSAAAAAGNVKELREKAEGDKKIADAATAKLKVEEDRLAPIEAQISALQAGIDKATKEVADLANTESADQNAKDEADQALKDAVTKKATEDPGLSAQKGDPGVLQSLIADEGKKRDAANASEKAAKEAEAAVAGVGAAGLTPAMMANLSMLFPQTVEVTYTSNTQPVSRASASRLIAFLSAMLLLIVGFGATCFFIYFYLVVGIAPDLSRLTGVLIALGIGMAPYAVNKVVNAASTGK